MRLAGAALLAAALLAAPALAQEQEVDPIGDALREAVRPSPPAAPPVSEISPPTEPPPAPQVSPPLSPPATPPPAPPVVPPAPPPDPDAEEAEDSLPAAPVPYTPGIVPPRAPAPYRPSASQSYTYEGYDDRLRSSFASAQGLLGALDGGWTLTDASGRRLFAFQLVDKGASDGLIEGVWRDLRRTPTPASSGLIGTIHRIGGQLTMSFAASRGGFTTLTRARSIDGSWGGRLSEPAGES
ncbi:MAG: hypothetical protein IT546_04830, partial [Caulobacteraceae bacterium]|nr:hypothetical protein [Caulobacteraceae bacterium]